MKLAFDDQALADLEDIYSWIARIAPSTNQGGGDFDPRSPNLTFYLKNA